jgi:hypothetical protein
MKRALTGALVLCAATAGADVWDVQDQNDDSFSTGLNELRHGGEQVHDLAVRPGSCAGQSGHVIIGHDGGYGGLAVKAVAVEPATGFTFDRPACPSRTEER